jgi:hypothetical protein
MGHTVTLLEDHKGMTTPKVSGDEYYVDAVIDITSYTANGETILGSSLGLSRINAVMLTGLSTDTISGGYSVSVISAETGAGQATGGKYLSGSSFQINVPAASNTDNIGELRVRIYGLL